MRRLGLVPLVLAAGAAAPAAASAAPITLHWTNPYRSFGHKVGVQGERVAVKGVVSRYVPGQKVRVVMVRGRRGIYSRSVRIRPGSRGRGYFRVGVTPSRFGGIRIDAVHRATAAQGRFGARAIRVPVVSSRGGRLTVGLLQRGLQRVHYSVHVNGFLDAKTGRALLAFRKVNGMPRTYGPSPRILHAVLHRRGAFQPRYRGHGHHVEADLSRQVLSLIGPGGRVYRTFPISSGKPSTPTVLGHFRVYRKDLGTNSEGMVDASYFIGGYAIHGYASVPVYNASHGCLRVPIPDAYGIFRWVHYGDRVDVYP